MDNSHIDRRTMFKLSAAALAGTAVKPGTPNKGLANAQAAARFPRVDVSPDRVIRQVVGLRPTRASGFVVRAEPSGDKTIIHNYGHGGGGVSLSWGTADLAAQLALQTTARKAAVLGCGAVGLATARLLQNRGFDVSIYAKELPPDTTSNKAAAMWGPVGVFEPDQVTPAFRTQFEHAARFANAYFQTLVGEHYGVRWLETFLVGSDPQTLLPGLDVVGDILKLIPLTPEANPFPTAYASRFYTMQIQTNIYLGAVLTDFLMRGGKLTVQALDRQAVLKLPERVIVNCTGLGATELFGDAELVPEKGQLTVLLPQPEINYGWVDGRSSLHMFPRVDGIALGETHEKGVTSLTSNPTEAERILNGVKDFYTKMRA